MIKELIVAVALTVGITAGDTKVPTTVEVLPIVEASPFYVGVGGGVRELEVFYDYITDDVDEYDDYLGVVLAGYQYNKYLGGEARYTFGENDFDSIGLYATGRGANSTIVTPYVGVGYVWSDYNGLNEDGVSLIGGVDVEVYENVKLFTDITYNVEPDEHVALVGVKYNF